MFKRGPCAVEPPWVPCPDYGVAMGSQLFLQIHDAQDLET